MPAPSPLSPIDLVDTADRSIGRIERGAVFEQRARFRVVHVFVFSPEGRLLLQQLGRNRERNPLLWGSSVAGYLNLGESYVDAAVRRLKEELGLSAPLVKHGSISMQDLESTKFITLYTTTAAHPRIAEPDHIEDLRFWPIEELEEALKWSPEDFTETFRYIYKFFRTTSALSV